MKVRLPKALNDVQRAFEELCAKGGGVKGGPARTKVQELLKESGQHINTKFAEPEITNGLKLCAGANPWKVCYAVGLGWGHLAALNDIYIVAAVDYLETGNSKALSVASAQHLERGPEPVEQSLLGGAGLFGRVVLPATLASSLADMRRAQDRWLSPILSAQRPRYIGSWNASAMFMVALFAQPSLSKLVTTPDIGLPPGLPIHNALHMLHQLGLTSSPPDVGLLDDASFKPGSIFVNTGLMAELWKGMSGWNLLDVHSGLYILGTRDPRSGTWYS